MKIVHQRASATSTPDLAAQLLALVESDAQGLHHTAGADALTRMEMVQAIARIVGKAPVAEEVPMSAMTWPARRPVDSSLDVAKVARVRQPMPFLPAARAYLEALA
jgi:dTDP-4-dehydrorhamnose reductase